MSNKRKISKRGSIFAAILILSLLGSTCFMYYFTKSSRHSPVNPVAPLILPEQATSLSEPPQAPLLKQNMGNETSLDPNFDQRQPIDLAPAKNAEFTTNKDVDEKFVNDPVFKEAWGVNMSDATRAWKITKGSRKVVVAIIDTGVDVNHPDIRGNLWTGPHGEHGWNFVENNSDLMDHHGHGTHIAGIIGATRNSEKGISGIAPEVTLMILKYFDPKFPRTDNLKNTIESIRYAIRMGADIINYSGGGKEFSGEEKAAIAEAESHGILFVAAAGNERSNSDQVKYYPADYGLANIISVTAINPDVQVLNSSNYGVETVDVAAPGQNILSTLPDGSYGFMTGTSQATAFVTGAAVLVKAAHPDFTASDIKKAILASGDAQESLLAKTKTYRRLNLYKALTIRDNEISPSGLRHKTSIETPVYSQTNAGNTGLMDLSMKLQQELGARKRLAL